MRRWLAFAPIAVLLALGVLFAGYALKRDPQVQPKALVGKPVPAVSLPDLETGRPMPIARSGRLTAGTGRQPAGPGDRPPDADRRHPGRAGADQLLRLLVRPL